MMRPSLLSAVCMLLCLMGCNAQPPIAAPSTLRASQLTASLHCDHQDATGKAVWLDNATDLRAIHGDLNKHRLGAPAAPQQAVNFKNEGVIAVFMGQKPTGGYGLSLSSPEISIKAKTAELHLLFEKPFADGLVAQLITSPCILVRMPRTGYSTIRILDQHGSLHHEIKLP